MNNIRKIAIFLLSLSKEKSNSILQYIGSKQAGKIISVMSEINEIKAEELSLILSDFKQISEQQEDFIPKNKSKFYDPFFNPACEEESIKNKKIKNLEIHDLDSFFFLICDEHPQVIAFILTLFEYDQSIKILCKFSELNRQDLLKRISSIESVSCIVKKEINNFLEEKISFLKNFEKISENKFKVISNIMNNVESDSINQLLIENLSGG
jgi:flagellar motor switch protein FliG